MPRESQSRGVPDGAAADHVPASVGGFRLWPARRGVCPVAECEIAAADEPFTAVNAPRRRDNAPRKSVKRRPGRGGRSPEWVELTARAGGFLLFESWLRHEVAANSSRSERVSVSFNYNWF